MDLNRLHFYRSEKYINFSRIATLFFLTSLWFVRWQMNPLYGDSHLFLVHLGTLSGGWLYTVFVTYLLWRSKLPAFVPWMTGVVDLGLVTLGLISQTFSPELSFPSNSITDNATYGLYFLIISFSILRRDPKISIFLSMVSALAYGVCAFLLGQSNIPPGYFYANETAKILFLLMNGVVATMAARFMAKTIEDSINSKAEARESENKLTQIALHLPGVILQFYQRSSGEYIGKYISPGVQEILGMTETEALKHTPLFLSIGNSEPALLMFQDLDGFSHKEASWTQEISIEDAKGQIKWLRAGVTLRKEPEGQTFNTLLLDITDRKLMEQQLLEAHAEAENANRAKSVFLATMSHELRTPLNGIMGLSEWLKHTDILPHQQKPLDSILQSAESLQSVINDVLDFSRLEAGQLRIQLQEFSFPSLAQEVFEALEPLALKKNLSLEISFSENFPAVIVSDPMRIKQVIFNLLENGIKYTHSGKVSLRGEAQTVKEGWMVQVHILDTGMGIPEKSRESIFEMFTQVEMGKTRAFGGVGLGLTICRSLAELLDGSLTVKSNLGEGSQFTFSFPAGLGSFEAAAPFGGFPELKRTKEMKPLLMGVLAPRRILLIEDNPVNQDVERRLLEKLGMEVTVVSGGLEALAFLETQTVDMVFIDWQMPVIDGVETAKRIRAEILGGEALPLVALSGHAFPGDRAALLSSGFDGYLSKPVRLKDFKEIIEKFPLKNLAVS